MKPEDIHRILARFPCLARLLGDIINACLSGPTSKSYLLRMLETSQRSLTWWESRACSYLNIIHNPDIAIASLKGDLLGQARSSDVASFDGHLKDAVAEVCVVVELSARGGTDFRRIPPPPGQGKKAPDFECLIRSDAGEPQLYCVEVKNCRAPVGVVDFINALYHERAKTAPDILKRSIELSHHWDNTVTEEQGSTLKQFFDRLSVCALPFESAVTIMDEGIPVEIRARVREGSGVSLTRGIGGDMPWGPFTKREKFLSHALAKVRKGAEQLKTRPDRKWLLALNIESPDATVDSDVLLEIRQVVDAEFDGQIEMVFLLSYQWLE